MINYTKVEYAVRDLKRQVSFGEIDQDTFEVRLHALIDIAPDGYYWMFGHESETWYQHDGKQWVQKDPGNLRLLQSETTSPNDETIDSQTNLTTEWRQIEWVWFVISLILFGLIGGVVYASV